MWTPRRVVLLSLGLGLFVFSYAIYIHFLGGIDGLPSLPEQYSYEKNRLDDGTLPPPLTTPANYVDDKLRMAFGEECIELKYPIKLWTRSRGMGLAAKEFRIDRDPSQNLLYGAGIHVCPGAALARMELRVILEELFVGTENIARKPGDEAIRAIYPAGGFSSLALRIE